MYALLAKRLPLPVAIAICVVVQTAAIVLVVLLSDTPFATFTYAR
jgi:hypothetical protein